MWHKFKKVDARGKIPKIYRPVQDHHALHCGDISLYNGTNGGTAVSMIGISPSGQIVDDFQSPGCDPYFIVTLEDGLQEFDVITDGEKYSWMYNKTEGRHCHYLGNECVLVKGCDGARILTTRDARIIKALIKAHLESVNVT